MALSANRELKYYASQERIELPVDADVNIFKGAFVGRNPTSGYARPLLAGDAFLGIAYRAADNSDGSAGDITVDLLQNIDIVHPLTGVGVDDIGKPVFVSADDTLSLLDLGYAPLGRIVAVEGTNLARVRCEPVASTSRPADPVPYFVLNDANATLSAIHLNRTLAMANTTARTVTLPPVAVAPFGTTLRFIKTSSAASAITLDGNSSETIDGAATFAGLDAEFDAVELMSVGTEWAIVSRDIA